MINIVLLLVISIGSLMLVLEDLGQDTFVLSLVCSVEVHSSAMDSVELVLDVSRGPWRSLTACRAWVIVSLSD